MIKIKDRKGSNIEKTVDRIIRFMPKGEEFRAVDIVGKVFPEGEKITKDGRYYNICVGVVARLLITINGVHEFEHGRFYAHKEYFNE